MDLPSSFEWQLRRARLDDAIATARARMAEARAVAACGGRGMLGRWRQRDRQAERRVLETAGLAGGELCGCGQPGCEVCGADGPFDDVPGGSSAGVPGWLPRGYRGQGGGDVVTSSRVTSLIAGKGWFTGASDVPIFDAHSHNFASNYFDWALTELWDSLGLPFTIATETNKRIGWLEDMVDEGVLRMVISGMFDGSTYGVDGATLDDITAYAWASNPAYFVPFVRGFDIEDSGAPAYVDAWLEAGFQGVGELFVHGHGIARPDILQSLIDICTVAGWRGVPVQFHWEFGNDIEADATKGSPGITTEESFGMLGGLLAFFPNSPLGRLVVAGVPPTKIIIAHCGAGPDMTDAAALAEYEARLDQLLSQFANVYFDIAGLQTDTKQQLIDQATPGEPPTKFGSTLLERMAAYPTRLMVGIDTENKSESDTAKWASTVENYRNFLTKGSLTDSDIFAIAFANAFLVTTPEPPSTLTVSTTSSTTAITYPITWP